MSSAVLQQAIVGRPNATVVRLDPPRHIERGIAFVRTAAQHQFSVHHQSVAVLDQHIAAVGQLRLVPPLFLASRASGSVVDACVSLRRSSP